MSKTIRFTRDADEYLSGHVMTLPDRAAIGYIGAGAAELVAVVPDHEPELRVMRPDPHAPSPTFSALRPGGYVTPDAVTNQGSAADLTQEASRLAAEGIQTGGIPPHKVVLQSVTPSGPLDQSVRPGGMLQADAQNLQKMAGTGLDTQPTPLPGEFSDGLGSPAAETVASRQQVNALTGEPDPRAGADQAALESATQVVADREHMDLVNETARRNPDLVAGNEQRNQEAARIQSEQRERNQQQADQFEADRVRQETESRQAAEKRDQERQRLADEQQQRNEQAQRDREEADRQTQQRAEQRRQDDQHAAQQQQDREAEERRQREAQERKDQEQAAVARQRAADSDLMSLPPVEQPAQTVQPKKGLGSPSL